MFPYELVQHLQQANKYYARQDQIVKLEESGKVIGHKLTGLRLTTREQIVRIEYPVYIQDGKWISKEHDERAYH
jgi:NDP-sugar pyrophosphorylase family protein